MRDRPPRVASCIGVALLAAGLAACDPCSGIVGCVGDPRLALEGRIVGTEDGRAVRGARVVLVRYGDDGAPADSVAATTNASGDFHLDLPTPGEDTVRAAIRVTPPGGGGYLVPDLRFRPTTRLGEAQLLPTWGDRAFFNYAGEVWPLDGSAGVARLADTTVAFVRVGGVEASGVGWNGDVVHLRTDPYGRFPLLGRGISTNVVGTLIGRVALVRDNVLLLADTVHLVATPVYQGPTPVAVFRLGMGFPYVGVVRIGDQPAPGVRVDFRRVGGAPGTPAEFSTVTREDGYFFLDAYRPTGPGDVVFDLVFTPPAPRPAFTKRVTLPVYGGFSTGIRFGVFRVDRPDDPPVPFT